jgi:hypothetical protein
MNRRWIAAVVPAAAMIAPLCLPAFAPCAEPERQYVKTHSGETARPVVAVDNVCAWPNLTVLGDGTIVATIFNKPSHGLVAGDVECWASEDGGKTWQKRGSPAPHEPEDANRMNVAAGLAKNGDLVVLSSGWSSRDASGKPGAAFRERILPAWLCRSSDGGRTWTIDKEAVPKTTPVGQPGIPFGDVLPAWDGSLCAALYCRHDGGWRSFVYRSRDDGKTWGEPVPLDESAARNETAIFQLGDGKWLAAARSDGLDLYRSDDDAKTWTHRRKLTGPQQHPGHFTRLGDGRVLLSYGNRVEPKGVDVRVSRDEGETWSEPLRVVDFVGDGGYPSSVPLPDGRVLTAYYASRTAGHGRYHMGVVIWDPAASLGGVP